MSIVVDMDLGTVVIAGFLAAKTTFTFSYGIGVFLPDQQLAEVKTFNLSYSERFPKVGLRYKLSMGMWADSVKSRRSSPYAAIGLGIQPKIGWAQFGYYWSIAGITTPDIRLSGHAQFMHDLTLDVVSDNGYYVGIGYKHISNAGMRLPNLGRDFFLIRAGYQF